ncbi:MAG: tRNA (adenosine(37)-N6)-dimethylallyltransferase MiaA [Planctomycetes bacterium]|nr:tRNA (adenosine(37)-N6)-dimethylallyltransferase MiaA [Planctomycetota bacterium]
MTPPANRPLLVLTGTTASGKNRAGVRLAQACEGEIISLDSMKVYRGMDLGTDKPAPADRAAVPHHLVDILEPRESMNLRRFVDLAHESAAGIRERGRLPLVVGGTALYLNGFLRGVLEGPESDPEFRRGLRAEASIKGVPALHARLQGVDPESAARIHPNDYKRVERALEVFGITGKPISALQGQWEQAPALDYRLYVLTWDRGVLDDRIKRRVDLMMTGGFLDEVRTILDGSGFGQESSQALGYKEAVAHLRGEITIGEATDLIKRRTRRFARRQLTWFRKWTDAHWIEGREGEGSDELAARVLDDYRKD